MSKPRSFLSASPGEPSDSLEDDFYASLVSAFGGGDDEDGLDEDELRQEMSDGVLDVLAETRSFGGGGDDAGPVPDIDFLVHYGRATVGIQSPLEFKRWLRGVILDAKSAGINVRGPQGVAEYIRSGAARKT